MIGNDQELAVTRERVAMFERMLEELRKTARPEPGSQARQDRVITARPAPK